MTGRAQPVAQRGTEGGGVWRIKWHPHDPSLFVIAAMHRGFFVMRWAEGGGTSLARTATYRKLSPYRVSCRVLCVVLHTARHRDCGGAHGQARVAGLRGGLVVPHRRRWRQPRRQLLLLRQDLQRVVTGSVKTASLVHTCLQTGHKLTVPLNGIFFWRSRRDLVKLRRQHVQRLGHPWEIRITVSTGRPGDAKRETYPRRLLPSTRAKCRNCPDQPGPSLARSPRLTVRPCQCMAPRR